MPKNRGGSRERRGSVIIPTLQLQNRGMEIVKSWRSRRNACGLRGKRGPRLAIITSIPLTTLTTPRHRWLGSHFWLSGDAQVSWGLAPVPVYIPASLQGAELPLLTSTSLCCCRHAQGLSKSSSWFEPDDYLKWWIDLCICDAEEYWWKKIPDFIACETGKQE